MLFDNLDDFRLERLEQLTFHSMSLVHLDGSFSSTYPNGLVTEDSFEFLAACARILHRLPNLDRLTLPIRRQTRPNKLQMLFNQVCASTSLTQLRLNRRYRRLELPIDVEATLRHNAKQKETRRIAKLLLIDLAIAFAHKLRENNLPVLCLLSIFEFAAPIQLNSSKCWQIVRKVKFHEI